MSELPCIYDMSLINESELSDDIVNGKALDVLIALLFTPKSARQLAEELKTPVYSIKLYLKRLEDKGLVEINTSRIQEGKLQQTYRLASNNIDILNYLKGENEQRKNDVQVDMSAKHFSNMTHEIIKDIKNYRDKPYKIKAYFIKANDEEMKQFKQELDELFSRYQQLEDETAKTTYSMINVFAPYEPR